MIVSLDRLTCPDVAAHYDDLDRFYRDVWGEHIHHGLWESSRESPEEATSRLIAVVAEQAGVRPGDAVCDVGCGYGGTARVLAREYRARVSAWTVSQAQYDYARGIDPGASNPAYHLHDWLRNDLPSESFEAAIAIESTEHMTDLPTFFTEAYRVLKPGGRLVVCAWLAREGPRDWERRWLLEPICREGRLNAMGTAGEYYDMARAAGLVPVAFQDLSRRVRRTWPICIRRVALKLIHQPSYRRFLFRDKSPNRIFALTIARIWIAYLLGSMRYGLLTARKPSDAEAHAKPIEGLAHAGIPS